MPAKPMAWQDGNRTKVVQRENDGGGVEKVGAAENLKHELLASKMN
jgi:hypothetical protein